MDKKLIIFNYILLLVSILIFGEYLINFANYSSSYILFLLFFILLALHVFVTGIIVNKEKVYKNNIKMYFILYIVLLICLTIFINRPDFALFDSKYVEMYTNNINIIPFKTIIHFLAGNVNLGVRIYNILGNMIALMPLVFLLILLDKKNDSYKRQLGFLFITVLLIEFFQFILAAGRLDIDDFILNIGGAMLFLFIIKKFKLITPMRNLFDNDLNMPKVTKYIILAFVTVAIIIMDILFVIDLNLSEDKIEHDYFAVLKKDENCNSLRKVTLDNYTLYIDCTEVYYSTEDDYYFTLEEAIDMGEIDINNLEKYFKIVEYLDEATVYRDQDFSLFTCNNSNDIYVGSNNLKYDGECTS